LGFFVGVPWEKVIWRGRRKPADGEHKKKKLPWAREGARDGRGWTGEGRAGEAVPKGKNARGVGASWGDRSRFFHAQKKRKPKRPVTKVL